MNTYFALALLVAVAGQHTAAANCDIPGENPVLIKKQSIPMLMPTLSLILLVYSKEHLDRHSAQLLARAAASLRH